MTKKIQIIFMLLLSGYIVSSENNQQRMNQVSYRTNQASREVEHAQEQLDRAQQNEESQVVIEALQQFVVDSQDRYNAAYQCEQRVIAEVLGISVMDLPD